MKNLLAIVGDYYPHPSSNTNCTDPLLQGLEQKGWHVDVMTVKQWLELPSHEIAESGREVWRIDDPRSMNTILQNQIRSIPAPRYLKAANKLLSAISKSLFYARYCLRESDKRYAGWSRAATIEKCRELHDKKHYNAVISVSHPAKCHEIAKGFIESLPDEKPRWILYELDPYCYNEFLYGKNCYQRLSSNQHALFEAADVLCLTPELHDFYQKTPFNVYREKMVPVGFPNMKAVEHASSAVDCLPLDDVRINCVFAGTLNNGIRNPQYALETFALCGSAVRLSVMTGFDLTETMKIIDDRYNSITLFPKQSSDTAHRTMERADVLVNIGNTVALQTPGKIFEYMALGKPIVHFQKIEDDPCLKYFHDYPMVLIVDERTCDQEKQARMIVEFCNQHKGEKLSFTYICQHMPQYVSENVVSGFVGTVDRLVSGTDSDGGSVG